MTAQITFPPSWMAEARANYDRYVVEWRQEEAERAVLTGDTPEEPETWEGGAIPPRRKLEDLVI